MRVSMEKRNCNQIALSATGETAFQSHVPLRRGHQIAQIVNNDVV